MADEPPILLSLEHGIARIILNRPERLNAFNVAMHRALSAALDEVVADTTVRVLLLTGAGRAFCAGQDLGERQVDDAKPLDLGATLDTYYNPLVRQILDLAFPVLCAVNGVAAGAGANLALLADLTVATRGARFIQSFTKIGLLPDCGGTWTLPRVVGAQRAMGMALLGDSISADQAADWGMIWRSIEDETFAVEVEALVRRIAAGPPISLLETKRAIRSSQSRTLHAQLDIERDAQRRLGTTADYREGVLAFKEKRPARFVGQ